MSTLPTEEELTDRIRRQLSWATDKYTASLIWKGYLAGLYEWDVIDLDVYTRVEKLLPTDGNIEMSELFGGEPLSVEELERVKHYMVNPE